MGKRISDLTQTTYDTIKEKTDAFIPIGISGDSTYKLPVNELNNAIGTGGSGGKSYYEKKDYFEIDNNSTYGDIRLKKFCLDIRKNYNSTTNSLTIANDTLSKEGDASIILLKHGKFSGEELINPDSGKWNYKMNNNGDSSILIYNKINTEPYIELRYKVNSNTTSTTRIGAYGIQTDTLKLNCYQSGETLPANAFNEEKIILMKNSTSGKYSLQLCRYVPSSGEYKWVVLCSQ